MAVGRALLAFLYIVTALLFGIWNDKMDKRYGTGLVEKTWLSTTIVSVLWPITVPVSLIVIVEGGHSRWYLPANQTKAPS